MPPPAKKITPPHKLEFATNSLRNTTLAVEDDRYYYEVVTRFWHPTVTKVNRLDPETRELRTVAEIDRTRGKEVKVRFLDSDSKDSGLGAWTKASEFVKYDQGGVGGTFAGPKGEEYRWKTHNRKLELIKADDEEKNPLVKYHHYKRHLFVWRMSRHAWLEVKPEMSDSMEKIIGKSHS
ncbi:hypothetical protein HGRIS_003220 [Hohenbuehelia grisea]|uniref:DUF6593 domain-containing protein n=1 Tax=Hohenbuehelia grisea TaxID=104357 RepID=A0ABR3JPA7_9AGAR